jgi:hypothetical protein
VQTRRLRAYFVALGVNAICALLFRSIAALGGEQFFSFWNQTTLGKTALTALFLLFGSRVMVWYTHKLHGYRIRRGRSHLRLMPLAFGFGVFAMTMSWLLATAVYAPASRVASLLAAGDPIDLTVPLVPLVFFLQFAFSQSTLIWYLAGGLIWPAAALHPRLRDHLLAYYSAEAHTEALQQASLSYTRTWNVCGYLLFILSLLFQS